MSGQSLRVKFILLVVVVCSKQMSGGMRDKSNDCSCISDTLTFECTVMSGLGTIWRGSALNCAHSSNEIYLLANNIRDLTCNDGLIIGRVIKREGNNFTSQLNVTLTFDLIGKIIECASYDGSQHMPIFNTTLDILPFPPPDAISLALVNFGSKEITFSWSPVAPDCPAIHYNILASNCGSCPTTTNHTNAICTYLPSDGSLCTLAVETVVCGNITGNQSKPLTLNITETLIYETSSKKADTISISIVTVGVSALLVTIMTVILACYWLRKRTASLKASSRINEAAIANSKFESSSSLQSQTNSQQEEDFQASHHTNMPCLQNKDMEYSQLEETPVNLKRLLEKLQGQISKQWYQLGLTLGLPMDVLEGFNLYSEDDCLVEVLDYWLKHHPGKPTWQEITDAQKKVEIFNTEQDAGEAEKKAAAASEVPPKKPPRRTSSVTMKKPMNTETTVDDVDHEYEVIH